MQTHPITDEIQKLFDHWHAPFVERLVNLEHRLDEKDAALLEMNRRLIESAQEKPEPELAPPVESTPAPTQEDLLVHLLGIIRDHGPRITQRAIADHLQCNRVVAHRLTSTANRRGWILAGYGEYRLTERGAAKAPPQASEKDQRSDLTAAINAACICKIGSPLGRQLLLHIATDGPSVSYETMIKAIGRSAPIVSNLLKAFISAGIVRRQHLLGARYHYFVELPALVGHAPGCAQGPANAPKPSASPSIQPSPPVGAPAMGDRLQFVFHMRTHGKLKGFTEQQHQEAFNTIYGLLANVGMDPRGKRDESGKKLKPVDYLEKSGLAAEALRLAREHFPIEAAA